MDMFAQTIFDAEDTDRVPPIQPCYPELIPSRRCGQDILKYSKEWTSWVHFGLDDRTFAREQEVFYDSLEQGADLNDHDPAWLAIYFANICATLLFMPEDNARGTNLPSDNLDLLLHSWYGASLYYLNASEYMRKLDVRTVQAIAILNICYNNFGDYNLFRSMWAVAIQIALKLGMGSKNGPHRDIGLTQEQSRRLWWTLIICEWLVNTQVSNSALLMITVARMSIQFKSPCISDTDFDTPLPSDEEDLVSISTDSPNPVSYHIALCKISMLFYWFRSSLRSRPNEATDIVQIADSKLADIITRLPTHLQPDAEKTVNTEERDRKYPWASWQKWDLAITFLYFRLTINRTMQSEWLVSSHDLSGQRAISLNCAKTIIWITREWEHPMEQRTQWASSLHMFTAAFTLVLESKQQYSRVADDWRTDVEQAIQCLINMKGPGAIARRGVKILEGFLQDT
jgi:hypothetical protein